MIHKNYVSSIPCINDACERACKLASDLNDKGPRTESAREEFYLVADKAKKIPTKSLTLLNQYYQQQYDSPIPSDCDDSSDSD